MSGADGVPAANLVCPLCAGPNDCGPARIGRFDTPCWCERATFPPGLIATLEPGQSGDSCLCARCAASHG